MIKIHKHTLYLSVDFLVNGAVSLQIFFSSSPNALSDTYTSLTFAQLLTALTSEYWESKLFGIMHDAKQDRILESDLCSCRSASPLVSFCGHCMSCRNYPIGTFWGYFSKTI